MKHGVWATALTQIDATNGDVYYVREKIQDVLKMTSGDRSGSIRLTLSADLIQMIFNSPETVLIPVSNIMGMSNVHLLFNFKYEWNTPLGPSEETEPPPCEENWRYPL